MFARTMLGRLSRKIRFIVFFWGGGGGGEHSSGKNMFSSFRIERNIQTARRFRQLPQPRVVELP